MSEEAKTNTKGAPSPTKNPKPHSAKLGVTNKTEVDFTKEWSDGHKSFNSSQVRALDELINTEMGIRDRYEILKGQIKRPRNPLTGEDTPRDSQGNIVMDPAKFHTVANGNPLFRSDVLDGTAKPYTFTSPLRKKQDLVGKIGVPDAKYELLGNTGSPSRTDNMYSTVQYIHEKKQKLREEQLEISQYVAREKARRYQTQLQREIAALHKSAEDKNAEISILKSKYNL